MVINLKEICDKTDMTQADFAKLTGISRYSVWKATEPAYDGIFNVPADRFYKIHCSIPDLLPLPDDFFHYTRPVFLINKYMYHYTQKMLPRSLYESKNYFLYRYKEMFDQLFPKLYLPYYIGENGEAQLYKGDNYILFDKEKLIEQPPALHEPVTWEHYQPHFKPEENMFEKYSVHNIHANLFCRQLSRTDFLRLLSTDMQQFMKEKVSFVKDGELLEQIFHPYIFLHSIQEERSRRNGNDKGADHLT